MFAIHLSGLKITQLTLIVNMQIAQYVHFVQFLTRHEFGPINNRSVVFMSAYQYPRLLEGLANGCDA